MMGDGIGKILAVGAVGAVWLIRWGISRLLSSSGSSSNDQSTRNDHIDGLEEGNHGSTHDPAGLKWKGPPTGEHMVNTDELQGFESGLQLGFQLALDHLLGVSHRRAHGSAGVEWKGPPSGEYMLNTDGSLNRKGAGYGAIIRDWKGDPVAAVAGKSDQPGSIILHELQGVEAGLELALMLGNGHRVHIGTDSQAVKYYFNCRRPKIPWDVQETWVKIKVLKSQIEIVKVEHINRKTNKAAGNLSRIFPSQGKITLRPQEFGERLLKIIQKDKEGRQGVLPW